MSARFLWVALIIVIGFTIHDALHGQFVQNSLVDTSNADSAVGLKFIHPRIDGHGRVVQLPSAAEQPRDGAKFCVDVTAGGPRESINPAIAKVARYVNIYAGAGRAPAKPKITVIMHGEATLCALSDEDYALQFQTAGNPNLVLMSALRDAGVEFLVCGQSLAGKGFSSEDACDDVEVAVSALTALVNRQADGYAYVPLLN